ncbi:MAG: sodium:solute symporter family protein [Synergistetes bacterium]|nr:sodium:solute symporter family protein [Synergistota bacterium]
MKFWVIFAVALYLAVGTALAFISKRGKSMRDLEEFFLAKRTLGGLLSALTYSATTYSAFMMIGLAGLTYMGGVGSLGFELTYLAGLVLVVWFGPKFWSFGKKYGVISPAEMLGKIYGSRRVPVVFSLVCLVFLIPYSAVQLMGIGYSLDVMTKGIIPFELGVVIAAAVAITWAFTGGMRSVAWTDALQAGIMLFSSLFALFFIVYRGFGGWGEFFSVLERDYPRYLSVPGPGFFTLGRFLGLTVPWFFFSISNPQVSQRLFVPKSLRSLRNMLWGFLVFGFVYTIVVILWGLAARALIPSLEKPDLATPTLLSLPIVPVPVALLVMIGVMSAAISTIDSILLTLSSMVSKDLFGDLPEEKQVFIGKVFLFLLSGIILLFAYMRPSMIVLLSVSSSAGLLALVPSIVGAFYWKGATERGAFWSITLGAIITGVLFASKVNPLGLMPGIWSIIIASVVFIFVSLSSPSKGARGLSYGSCSEKGFGDSGGGISRPG